MPSPLEQFDAATARVTEDRGAVYGHPADDFGRVTAMAKGIRHCADPLVKHALYMILVKVARAATSPDHVDSFIDIAGYARTAVMVIDRQAQEAAGLEEVARALAVVDRKEVARRQPLAGDPIEELTFREIKS